MVQLSSLDSYTLPARIISDGIGSETARLADLQALVASILAEMEALSAELKSMVPPEHPQAGGPDLLMYRAEMRRFRAAQDRILAKLAQLNLKLELAYRGIGETEAKLNELQARLAQAQQEASRQVDEERRRVEAALKELAEMRKKLEEATHKLRDAFAARDGDSRLNIVVIPRQVGIHLDRDGRPDGKTNGLAIILRDESAQREMSRWTVDPLEVLPAGEAVSVSLVERLADEDLEVQRTGEGTDGRWALLASVLINPEHPGGFARPEVWAQTAAAMGVSEETLVLRVLGLSADDPALASASRQFQDTVARYGAVTDETRAVDFAWRRVAGERLGDPLAFLRDTSAAWCANLPADALKAVLIAAAGGEPPAPATHRVQRGESMSAIAAHYGVSLNSLIAANPEISNPSLIYPDQIVRLPPGTGAAVPQSGGHVVTHNWVTAGREEFNAEIFKQQFRSTFNPDGPLASGNCVPASLAMALEAFGLEPAGLSTQESIDRAREAMHDNDGHPAISAAQLEQGAAELGIQAQRTNYGHLDEQLAQGRMVVLFGKPVGEYRDAFSNYSNFYGLHAVLVVGKGPEGYLVADPLSRSGAVWLTQAQLAAYGTSGDGYGLAVWR